MTSRRRVRRLAAVLALPALLLGTGLVGAAWAARPTPGTVFLQTVPALGGVHLLVGSIAVTTRSDGTVTLHVSDINGAASRVTLGETVLNSRTTLALATVRPEPHVAKYQSHLTVGLDVTSLVTLRVDPGHTGVPASNVGVVRLHSLTGQTVLVDVRHHPSVRLLSRMSRLVAGQVTAQVVTWSVDSVRAGVGVSVTTDRGRFDPFTDPLWGLLLRPVAGSVVVDTVPATPGVSFLLDGASFSTDAKGSGTTTVADLNGVDTRITLGTDEAADSASVAVLRVTRLKPAAAYQRHLLVALAVSRPVTLSFRDPVGRPVSSTRVSKVLLDGGGSTVTVPSSAIDDPVSLLAVQARLVDGKWAAVPVTYSVTGVMLEGADAVFAGQQRFEPSQGGSWPISLSVFDVTVTVRDVLFGARISSKALLTRPDGVRYAVELAGSAPTHLTGLVRGQYTLDTKSAMIGADAAILVSKDTQVDLRVVTLPDAIVLTVVGLLLAGSVLLLGRRLRRRPTWAFWRRA